MRLLHTHLAITLFSLSKVCIYTSNTQKDDLSLQNIIKYCNSRHSNLNFPCLSMFHMKRVYLLRQQLLQEERSPTRVSLLCSIFLHTSNSLQASPMTAHSTTHSPTGVGTPVSPLPRGRWGLLTQSCSRSYSQNPGPNGVNSKCATNPPDSVSPLLRLWSVSSLDLFPTPHGYLQATETHTHSATCVTQSAWICTVLSEPFPEIIWYF